MNDLLKGFLKTKYNFDDEKATEFIKRAVRDGELAEWYQIAIVKFNEELEKNMRVGV